jgi:hypothetical protein
MNGMVGLSAQEFCDALSMRYGDTPYDLPVSCDSCDAHFTLQHVLSCKKGGLVIFCHNKIQDKLVHMVGKAMTPSTIHDEPLIHPGHAAEIVKTLLSPSHMCSQSIPWNGSYRQRQSGLLVGPATFYTMVTITFYKLVQPLYLVTDLKS